MIRLKQIQTLHGMTKFTFEYDVPPDPTVFTVKMDERELMKRLNNLHSLLGRDITKADMKFVVIAMIKEIRVGDAPWLPDINYASFIGINLE